MADRLQEIRDRAASASPGPWVLTDGWGPADDGRMRFLRIATADLTRTVVGTEPGADIHAGREDAEFIAHARADVDWLLGECDAKEFLKACAEAALQRAEAALQKARAEVERLRKRAECFESWANEWAKYAFDPDEIHEGHYEETT